MKVYTLFLDGKLKVQGEGDGPISAAPSVDSLKDIFSSVKSGQEYITSLSVDDIIGLINTVSMSWQDRKSPIQQQYARYGLNFLLYWFRDTHLRQILDVSLRGNRKALDGFCDVGYAPYKLSAQPRGVICHWLAGNVPMLGMLSLVQGMLTKNANILKVPRQNGYIIPHLLASFDDIVYRNDNGKEICGSKLVKSVAAIYFERDDKKAQEELSSFADVRVAWGGLEAVESVMNLSRRYGCDDVIFGPKTSFMVIGREYLDSEEKAKDIARRAATDASLFEQQGCNSPHTVFVERGGKVTPKGFAKLLAGEMEEATKRYPKAETAPADTVKILRLRTEYDIRGEAFYPPGVEWAVLYSDEDTGLATPCYNRTLFVRPINDVMEAEVYCSHLTQSVGAALSLERKTEFARRVTQKGVDRCPEVGSMMVYEVPWDGMFIMDRLVRWCKL